MNFTTQPIEIDMNGIVGAITSVMMEPYMNFIRDLHTAGRISDEELAAVNKEFEDRVPRLAELVQARLADDAGSQPEG